MISFLLLFLVLWTSNLSLKRIKLSLSFLTNRFSVDIDFPLRKTNIKDIHYTPLSMKVFFLMISSTIIEGGAITLIFSIQIEKNILGFNGDGQFNMINNT
ncbi:hypothetical protein H8356DRAFT_1423132 [Neocallimastix lanati (nom. inval.)]|nr:hypothetical protein H8356DRAFT_1423132 [Neocallimastix sp. JGI-2020a]